MNKIDKKTETVTISSEAPKVSAWQPSHGRRTKLTPELIEEICVYIAEGQTLQDASELCGITSKSLQNWRAKAEEIEKRLGEEDPETDEDKLFLSFFSAYKHARAQANAERVRYIRAASITDWRAAAWHLERADPAQYGTVQRHAHEFTKYSDEQLVAEAARLFGEGFSSALGSALGVGSQATPDPDGS
jgi:hypothetical protein